MLDAALAAMVTLGAEISRIVAGIGPAVAPRAYQVGPEVARAIGQSLLGPPVDVLTADGTGRWKLDLVAAIGRELSEDGVSPARVQAAGVATGGDGPFFSDRQVRPCGRFALLARLRP